jgi:hypothetical protein
MIAAWIAFPVVLLAIAVGCGLLLERATGDRLGPLLVPAGLAVVIVAANFTTMSAATVQVATALVIVLAIAGYALSWPFQWLRRPDGWAGACAVGVFAVYAAPIVLSGDNTIAGYMKLEDTATWLSMTDQVMSDGRSLADLPPSAYEAILRSTFDLGYPVGAFLPWGVVQPLVGQDLAWLLQPYMAFLGGVLALAIYALAAPLVESRPLRALIAFISSQPALLFGFMLWGAVKELLAVALLALLAALLPHLLRTQITPRSLIPAAVVTAATLATLSVGGAVWIAPLLAPALWAVWAERGRTEAIRGSVAFVALAALFSIPSLVLAGFVSKGSESFTGNEDLGNLIEPLNFFQAFGIWPAGDFRLEPDQQALTWVLIVAVVALAVGGVAEALRRRAWGLLGFVATAAFGCLFFSVTGAPWIVSKALAEAAPAFVLAALIGAVALLREQSVPARARVVLTSVALVAIGGGVLWSNALAYREVDLAPHDRFAELETIGEQIDGEGPTLTTEYEFWGVRHFLRDAQPEGASLLSRRQVALLPEAARRQARQQQADSEDPLLIGGGAAVPSEGLFYDIDDIRAETLLPFRTLVLRRSPVASRPPSAYELTWRGRYYEVWQRPAGPPPPLVHVSLGNALKPAAVPRCREVLGLTRLSQVARLVTVERPDPIVVPLTRTKFSPSEWERGEGPLVLHPRGEATLETTVAVPRAGRYGIWLGGSFRGTMEAFVDGRRVGSARGELNYSRGQYQELGSATLSPGPHQVRIRYEGASLRAGSAGDAVLPLSSEEERGLSKKSDSAYAVGPLVLSTGTAERPVSSVPPAEARRLCGRPLDWVEARAN